jgi:hypothetical protein
MSELSGGGGSNASDQPASSLAALLDYFAQASSDEEVIIWKRGPLFLLHAPSTRQLPALRPTTRVFCNAMNGR